MPLVFTFLAGPSCPSSTSRGFLRVTDFCSTGSVTEGAGTAGVGSTSAGSTFAGTAGAGSTDAGFTVAGTAGAGSTGLVETFVTALVGAFKTVLVVFAPIVVFAEDSASLAGAFVTLVAVFRAALVVLAPIVVFVLTTFFVAGAAGVLGASLTFSAAVLAAAVFATTFLGAILSSFLTFNNKKCFKIIDVDKVIQSWKISAYFDKNVRDFTLLECAYC